MFLGFHSLENKIIAEGINLSVNKESEFRGAGVKSHGGVKGAKVLDFSTKPNKQELNENSASKSAELYSVWFGYDDTVNGGRNSKKKPKGGWSGQLNQSVFKNKI